LVGAPQISPSRQCTRDAPELNLCKAGAMRAEPQLRVRVVGDEIVVTLPGYHYAVTYFKPSQGTRLIARNSPITDDPRITMKKSEFLARAWKLANAKARDLGWIV
jgi:hypothetical protein